MFTVFKLRAMRTNSEQLKARLADQHEGNGVLLEMYDDPRITRASRLVLLQVSGRSDLSWEEFVEFDVHYTDNHRLSDDPVIGLHTIEAVAPARGAY